MPAKKAIRPLQELEEAPATTETIGPHIRAARQAAQLTLAEVARELGLSVGYLSEIERSRMTPSLSALKKIADVLRISASKVMFEFGGRDILECRRRRRAARGAKADLLPAFLDRYELLTPISRRRCSLFWMTVPPRTESGPSFSHAGEDGVIVLKGTLKIEVGNVWHTLSGGDSIYFNSEIAHRWKNERPRPGRGDLAQHAPSF